MFSHQGQIITNYRHLLGGIFCENKLLSFVVCSFMGLEDNYKFFLYGRWKFFVGIIVLFVTILLLHLITCTIMIYIYGLEIICMPGCSAWCAKDDDPEPSLTLDLLHVHTVQAIIIQGLANDSLHNMTYSVTSVNVTYSVDSVTWQKADELTGLLEGETSSYRYSSASPYVRSYI